MADYLKIKKVKKINDEITLENIFDINYLVGVNGSGKSSVLDAIALLKDSSNSRKLLNVDSRIELSIGGKKIVKTINIPAISSPFSPNAQLSILVSVSAEDITPEKAGPGVIQHRLDLAILGSTVTAGIPPQQNLNKKMVFDTLKKAASILNMPDFNAVLENKDIWNDSSVRTIQQNNTKIDPSIVAGGLVTLTKLFHRVSTAVSGSTPVQNQNVDVFLVLIEEPENHLHPKFQREIPRILNDIRNSLGPISEKVKFFVSTHSPFVLGEISRFSNQKAYLFDDGKMLNMKKENCLNSDGVAGGQCAWLVSNILGAEITDLGYPENYCVLEEASLQGILQKMSELGIIKNMQFISTKGWSNSSKIINQMKNIETASNLIKCNPYYFDKYIVILDNTSDFSDKDKEKVLAIKMSLEKSDNKNRFIELSKKNIEDYYSNIDAELAKEYEERKNDQNAKKDFSIRISEKIKSAQDFSKLFDKELDFLLVS